MSDQHPNHEDHQEHIKQREDHIDFDEIKHRKEERDKINQRYVVEMTDDNQGSHLHLYKHPIVHDDNGEVHPDFSLNTTPRNCKPGDIPGLDCLPTRDVRTMSTLPIVTKNQHRKDNTTITDEEQKEPDGVKRYTHQTKLNDAGNDNGDGSIPWKRF